MFKAVEAQKKVAEYKNEIEMAEQQKAEQFCETTVSEVIETMAKMGKNSAFFKELPTEYNRISRILIENGYKTAVSFDGMRVMW